ncbi:glycerol dehydrogenase [Allofournierella massiliensis]|uniref:glycerol dehydrogenase n=1 Tax=Allofournierella massiliensis TaxID=1650663 RepID=UPI0039A38335
MANVIGSPSRYVQGRGELAHLYEHCEKYGKDLFVLVSASGKKRVEGKIAQSVEGTGAKVVYETFNGECSQKEIDRVVEAFKASGCSVVVGIGGGKIHDTAKAAAYYAGAPVAIVPTIASTDAPCSALSVIYTDEGVFDRYLFLPANPTVVLVDTDIVAAAPARLLVSGMGDALATYFEARACQASGASNCVGGKVTLAAMSLARLCYETLLADGLKAKLAVERHVCTTAVENVIEANTYLSGVGFESGGLAGAHAIHNGLTAIPETHSLYHGEKVAFGTLVQLVLENAPLEELEEVLEFCTEVGLPTTLADLGVENPTQEQLMEVAKLACADADTLHNMPFPVDADSVYAAILAADELGKYYTDC